MNIEIKIPNLVKFDHLTSDIKLAINPYTTIGIYGSCQLTL